MIERSAPAVRHMRELARHMTWADASVWNAVLATREAASDSKIADTLHHIHLVQHIFLQAWMARCSRSASVPSFRRSTR